MRKFSVTFLIISAMVAAYSFRYVPAKQVKVNWQTTDSVSAKWQEMKKPILVDIYTDWCHYCKVMDNTTYSNDSVAAYINQNFYSAKINAESKTPFNWMGKVYNYIPKYKVNQLAIELTKGNMVYPSTIIIPPTGEPQVIGGAISKNEMEMILKYFGGDNYGKKDWSEFVKDFKSNW